MVQISQSDIKVYEDVFFEFFKYGNKTSFENFDRLLINFNKYLYLIGYETNYEYIKSVILTKHDAAENSIKRIKNIMNGIIEYYKNLDEVIKKQDNYLLSIVYCNLIIKCIFIIYQYYYLSLTIPKKFGSTSVINDEILNQISFTIINDVLSNDNPEIVEEILNNIPTLSSFDDSNKTIDNFEANLSFLYQILIFKFNLTFYNLYSTKYLFINYLYKHKPILQNIRYFLSDIVINTNSSFIKKLKQTLLIHIEILDNIYSINEMRQKQDFITIPQYTNICWFISFIMGITYSDGNRKLLLKKEKDNNLTKKNIMSSNINEEIDDVKLFIFLVFFIIKTITEKKKRYSDFEEIEKCKIFKIFKEIPMLFIKRLIANFKLSIEFEIKKSDETYDEKTKNEKKEIICKKVYDTNDLTKNYFLHIFQQPEEIIHDNSMVYAISRYEHTIFKLFYSYLGINCSYIYYLDDIFYKYDDKDDNPEIIMIDYTINDLETPKNKELISIIKRNFIQTRVEFQDKNIIEFNGSLYMLDYVLNENDVEQTCSYNCGHIISCINYHGEEYYYDSYQQTNNMYCDDDYIIIPCSLIKKDWKKI